MAGTFRANNAQIGVAPFSPTVINEVESTPLPGLDAAQWKTLLQMLDGSKPTTTNKMFGNSMTWIIDTGASNHMTGEMKVLRDLEEINQCLVGLPDGNNTIATKKGTVNLNRNFCLKNVLYVPGLTCNLISVSQLTEQYDYIVQFTHNLCVIQERTSRTLIGAGERQDGLYYFCNLAQAHAMKTETTTSLELWHKRLGHPSLKTTKLIPGVSTENCKDRLEKHCEGTVAVKGMALNLTGDDNLCFNTIAFKKMKRLKLLQLGHVRLEGSFEYISKELRWLCWHGFPLNYMPENFYQENIVAIDLKYSNLRQVWKNQLLERLKFLNLSHSYYLRETPDFSKIPNLERLILKDCPRLTMVHPSIGNLKYLILVNLKDCKDLNQLPRSLYKLKSLKTLNVSGCSRIDKLEEDIEQMESLTTLLANETAISQVPFSLVRSRSIKYVSLCGHEGLPNDIFPPLIWSWMSPINNPRSLVHAFASMPFLLQNLWHGFYNQRSANLEPSAYQLSCTKTPKLLGFHDQVQIARAENFTSSLTIQVGIFNNITDALLKNISQGWSEGVFGCSLPGNNYPHWLVFENEGSSISFTVSQVVGYCLKGMILCIIYSSSQESMAFVYPVSVTVKNFTKTTIEFYKRDAETAPDDEEWQNLMCNLEPGNEVEVIVAFARKYTVKKTAIYLVYGDEIDKKSELNITKGLLDNEIVEA